MVQYELTALLIGRYRCGYRPHEAPLAWVKDSLTSLARDQQERKGLGPERLLPRTGRWPDVGSWLCHDPWSHLDLKGEKKDLSVKTQRRLWFLVRLWFSTFLNVLSFQER